MPPARTTTEAVPTNNRSAVTNGARHFLTPGGEQSVSGRRSRDIYDAITEDLGGVEHLSEAERQLARRCAQLAIEAEIMEDVRATGGALDIEAYIAIVNAQGRALSRLGLRRRQRDVTPSLVEYLGAKAEEAE